MAARKHSWLTTMREPVNVGASPSFRWHTQGINVDILDEESQQFCREGFMLERLPRELVKGDVLQLGEDLEIEVKRIVIQQSCEWTVADCEFLRLPLVNGTTDVINWDRVRKTLGKERS